MDIRNVGNKGSVEQGKLAKRPEGKRAVLIPQPPRDEARISEASRETAAAVENLAERARTSGASEREQIVQAAKQKLLAGELGSDAVFASTARRLLDAKFLSA